jgi:hypothetical protein
MRPYWLALLACTGCSTFVEHRAALVPHATPVQNIGQPNTQRTAVTLGATNIADLAKPGVGDPDAGVAIPSRQLRGSFVLAFTRNLSLTLVYEHGLASSAQPVKDTLPPLDDKAVTGRGSVWSYSIATNSPWRVGVSLELIGWSVPYVEYSTCIENCYGENYTIITRDTAPILSAGLGIVPSYRLDNWVFFGGLTVRNHPTIEEKVISNGFSTDVEGGPANAIAHAGVAYDASDRVRFKLEMHQTLTRDPVAYAPAIGFGFELGLGPAIPPLPPRVATVQSTPPSYAPDEVPDPAQAATLAEEAHMAAQAGECDRARVLMVRVQQLDAQTFAVAMQDKLIAYCVSP